MGPEIISIIVLVVMFIVGTVLPINLGIMGFVAAFLIGTTLGGLSADNIFEGFPANLFVLLAGVTLLFVIAENNGTINLLTDWSLGLVRGNIGFIPWIMFGLTALLCSVGALSAAGVAVVAPVAMQFAARYSISPLLMGVMVVQGATAGSYSPISPFGVITNGVLASNELPQSPGLLFINSLVFNVLVAALVFVILGGVGLLRKRADSAEFAESEAESGYSANGREESEEGTEEGEKGLTLYKGATLAGIALLRLRDVVHEVGAVGPEVLRLGV